MESTESRASLGRPRAFNLDRALERALGLFWEKGYEGTSLSDLTKAIGINRPSLYAAFGNKEALFRKALDRYVEKTVAFVLDAINEPTARRFAERLLHSAADMVTNPHNPPGCLTVRGGLASGEEADPIRLELALRRSESEALIFRKPLDRAKRKGDLPPHANPAISLVISQPCIKECRSRQPAATREQLRRVAGIALRAWPK